MVRSRNVDEEALQTDVQRYEDAFLENGFGEKTLRQSWAPAKELSFSPAI